MLHSALANPSLQVPARNKAGMETGAGNWKEGSRCAAETAVPTAISSEHAGRVQLTRCMCALQ